MVNQIDNKKLISIEEALECGNEEAEENYRRYMNPQFAMILKTLGFNKNFVKAKDMIVWDKEGNEYLDFLGGYGSLNVGHNNEFIIDSLNKINHMPNILQLAMNPLTSVLAKNLATITPGDLKYTFFCNSGAEAVEGALKIAKIATKKSRVIYCKGAFHGKSMGALSVTGRDKYKQYFEPMVPLATEVPYGDLSALKLILEEYNDVAAFIVEPIQGEGGIILPPVDYLRKAKKLCSQYGVLLIADEIQTGLGRTGHWFACDAEDVVPDIMCIAKSLSGGIIPIGAYITKEEIWKSAYGSLERCLLHTSTFGGNTWAAAAGISTIQFIEENNLQNEALEKGNYVLSKLVQLREQYPILKDVRGRGLMIGLEFSTIKFPLINNLMNKNMQELIAEYTGAIVANELMNHYNIITAYTLNNPNVIRIEPPLTVTYEQLDRFINALEDILIRNKSMGSITLNAAKNIIKSVVSGGK
ncbi:aspartate aminotransferase family protein [Alkaliphilus oremlandii]|uniref:Aminotransferase class-III n=1 Tax=Alkaliphilus oremlandii (strain OhILAs) TaxID=350688 RepID=A8MJG9_ALKOO|nr:aspartate aminotransferase family protein [Alkaliphilus oremlandii]ABW19951.1 aminotransferase class-III [Alkaliphilus oremlandii OhILAs]